ncbi:plc-like phosphodiesterase TIM beta alpha-barrel domain-containing protein [Fusarium mundagurra]|uniref:Plc-like phosphodiesterase TIM beta alpha-barrel domain-containing protein n=1 Tax=Fusarium mundagurra TaxID=1567541 RepID=A0A8H5YQH8_9HYPO|nr:plc-like phosphodiesterase TIM beta alpha-barrel domain-containing protein [Fusarium mundagurra]
MRVSLILGFATAAFAACNGHDELCGRKYSDITFIGTHNSAFVGELPINNQYISVSEQLNLGVRFLQAQTQDKNGDIQMCHTHCWQLDAGPLHNYLEEISGWIGKNPDEVVTILLTNVDALPIEKFDEAFNSAGLKDLVFRPKKRLSRNEWPTLQELLGDGTRLIVFMDYNMDESKVDYILDEFDYFWETPFGETDPAFPTCKIDRPENGDPTVLMGIMNHMLNHDIMGVVMPDQVDTERTNSEYSIQKQVDLCESSWGRRPNVVLLDWVNVGEAMDAQISLNGLQGSHS